MCSGLSCKGGWERAIFSFFHGGQVLSQSWECLRCGAARRMTRIYCEKPPGHLDSSLQRWPRALTRGLTSPWVLCGAEQVMGQSR